MAKRIAIIVILGTLAGLPAWAGHDREYEWAKVVSSTPVYESVQIVTPRRECWTERVAYQGGYGWYNRGSHGGYDRHRRSATPTLLGATVGGVIGNELGGKGRSKRVATVVGALIGGSIGRDIGRSHQRHHGRYPQRVDYRSEQRCETHDVVSYEEQVTAYDVEYRYRGRTYRTQMDYDPEDRIKVFVQVTPAF